MINLVSFYVKEKSHGHMAMVELVKLQLTASSRIMESHSMLVMLLGHFW